MVGPAYKSRAAARVGDGTSRSKAGCAADELHDVFESFARMVNNMRADRQRDIIELDTAIESASKAGATDLAASLRTMRERLQKSLD